ncbi:MAG: hypothetical protein ABFS56_12610 [Pseudomonadota bacterium]
MNPKPLPNHSKHKTEMSELFSQPASMNEFSVTQLKNKTRQLVNYDPMLCYIAFGAMASLQYDIDQVHAQFKMALHTAGADAWIVQLYAIALNNICLPYEASDLLMEYQSYYPNEFSLLRDSIESCVNTGRAFRGEALLAHWHKLTDMANPYETTIQQWADFYRRHDFTESQVQPILETALSLVRQSLKSNGFFLISTGYANYDGAPYLYYTIHIDLPVDDLLELEEQHNDLLLTGNFKESLLDNIIITFEHLTVEKKAAVEESLVYG